METLYSSFIDRINRTETNYVRDFINQIDWTDRLIGIKGARGVGKTTLLLQYIAKHHKNNKKALYVTLDDLYFSMHSVHETAHDFIKKGGTHLFIDEVHKYAAWARDIKNIYDTWKELHIVFTGSSILHIHDARGDLSRRAMVYEMHGLSYREFLNMTLNLNFKKIALEELLLEHQKYSKKICRLIKPLEHFDTYLRFGYYPYFFENRKNYLSRLMETLNYIIEVDLVHLRNVDPRHTDKLKKLLYVLAENVPFKPNISNLSEKTGIARNTLLSYLKYFEEANILRFLHADSRKIGALQKPEKIYLDNPNLYFAISAENANTGSLRETFFANQLSRIAEVNYHDRADFKAGKYVFEVGGKNKGGSQITGLSNAFLVKDDIEHGFENKIPLWLFGFLD